MNVLKKKTLLGDNLVHKLSVKNLLAKIKRCQILIVLWSES